MVVAVHKDLKVGKRLDALRELRREVLPTVNATVQAVWSGGIVPTGVRVRRDFYRLQVQKPVLDERTPLPKSERPLAAQMVTPKGLHLRLLLMLLYAAQCTAKPGGTWRTPYPVEWKEGSDSSLMRLMASVAAYKGPGILGASAPTNRRRQITQALLQLEQLNLVRPTQGPGRSRQGYELLSESGSSTVTEPVPYTVPADTEGSFIELPIEFFTHGWIHVLTMSEIAALLMWFDTIKFHATWLETAGFPIGHVPSDVRLGRYGLSRDAYETHMPLDAFQLIDVIRPDRRYEDGKWMDWADDSSDMYCHRVAFVPGGFARDAGSVVQEVVERRAATREWSRPLHAPERRLDRIRFVDPPLLSSGDIPS
ncbi:hypothetical protein [Streptomyces sp. NPDC017949]|uniref:hypothetical protein n=1 Tax=Streptomyces sp. NPDC017949 TaxID=3365020 RepID=UPI003787E240